MLLSNLNLFATAPGGVARLRELILTLAVQGKLLPQNPQDEPASVLLKKIRAEKDRLIAEGKIKRDKPLAAIAEEEKPFEVPVEWAWVRLGDVVGMLNGYAFKSEWFKPAGVRLLRNVNIGHGRVDWTQPEFIDAATASEFEQFALQEGDVVLTLDRPIISTGLKLAVLTATDLPCFLLQRVARLAPEPKVMSQEFLVLWMKSDLFMDTIDPGRSTGVPHISTKQVGNLVVGLPPLAEQSRIVTRVEELMRLCDALEAKGRLEAAQHAQLVTTLLGTLTESDTPAQLAGNWQRLATHFDLLLDRPQAVDALEQTILQLAVRGLLVPQDPTDEPASAYLSKWHSDIERNQSRDAKHVGFNADIGGLPQGWCIASVASVAECLDFMRKPVKKDSRGNLGATVPYYGANGQVGWIENFLFDEDLVLVVEDETFIGRTKPFSYIVRGKSWVNNHSHVLRPMPGMSVEYLDLCLQRYDFIPLTSGTTNRRKLTKAGLLDAQFMLAPLVEQSRIVTRVAQLRHLCADLRQRLTASQSTQAQLAEALVAGAGS